MNKNLYKNFSFVVVGRIVSAALQGIFYLMFAYILDPDAYGQMSYFIAIGGTFSIIFRFGLPFTATVYQAKNNKPMADQINVLALLTTSAAAVIVLFINPFIALYCLGLSFFVMSQQNLLGLKLYKKQMVMSILEGAFLIAFPLALFFVLEVSGILLGMGFATILTGYYFIKLLRRRVTSFKDVKKNFSVLVHNFGFDVSLNLPRMIDKLAVVPLLGFTIAGIYQFNLQILLLMEIFPVALHQFMLSEESSGVSNKKMDLLAIMGAAILTVVVILAAPTVINALFYKFHEGIPALQIIVISAIPLTISAILNAKLQAQESTRVGLAAIVRIGALLGFIVLLGGQYGLIGLSLAVVISTVLNAAFLANLYYRKKIF